MICQQLSECIENLEKQKVESAGKKGNKKEAKIILKNYPCNDSTRVDNCIEYFDNRQKPGCSEKGKSYILDIGPHPFDCACVHIDGGVVDTKECRKCDFAFFLSDSGHRVILVELKGSAVRDALEQLKLTLYMDELQNSFIGKRIYGRIACTSSVPKIYTKDQLALQKEFLKHNGNLKIGKASFIEQYDSLDKT